jgi:hypothetical protein
MGRPDGGRRRPEPRREGGGRERAPERRARRGGDDDAAVRQVVALVEVTRGWLNGGSSADDDVVRAMTALSRVGRREVQGEALPAVQAMIQEGCQAIVAPGRRKPADTLLFLQVVQRMLYQEALTLEESSRQQAVERVLAVLAATHASVQQQAWSAAPDADAIAELQLLLELTRAVGCFLYEVPAVSGQVLATLVCSLQPLLEFPRDMPTSSSAVVAATLLQQQQQQQQPQLLLVRHAHVLLSACSADALANAAAGLGRIAETFATDVIPQLVVNLHAWSSLVTASLSLEGLAAENGADVDVYMEALTGTLRALHIFLGEVGSSSSSATTVAQALAEVTLADLRGGRLLPSLAECLVNIVLWVPSQSAVVAAQAAGQLKGISDSDASAASGADAAGGRVRGGKRTPSGRGEAGGGSEGCSSTDGASTDDTGAGGCWRQRAGGGGAAAGGVGGSGGSLGRIRLNAVLAIHGLARLQPKVFFPFWAQLLPSDAGQPRRGGEKVSLVSMLVSDPSPKVRTAVAMALQALLQRSRTYMAAAEERRATVSSFLSFSQSLAMRISTTHTALCQAVRHETHATTAQHVIKALMALVAHAPYRRLRRGLLGESVAAMRTLLGSVQGEKPDVQLRTAAMGCLASLLENPLTVTDLVGEGGVVLAPLARRGAAAPQGAARGGYGSWGPACGGARDSKRCSGAAGSAEGAVDASGDRSVEVLLEDLIMVAEGTDGDANPVKVEALKAVSGVVRSYCPSVLCKWASLGPLLRSLLESGPPPLRTHSAKVIECLVGATEDREEEEEEGEGEAGSGGGGGSPVPSTPARSHSRVQAKEGGVTSGGGEDGAVTRPDDVAERLPRFLWDEVATELLPKMLADESPSVRASAMNTIGFLPTNHALFGSLLEAVWTCACPGDNKDSAVRGAALKTLGTLTHVEPYSNDVQFIIKVSDALDRCSRDPFIAVRLKAFLALAHLCERSLIIAQPAQSEYLRHHAGLTLVRLSDMALRSINDHDKVRVYGARALGYLASAPEFVTLVQRSTSTAATRQLCARIECELSRIIASKDYSVKVRWNACHAAKLILSLAPPSIPGEVDEASGKTAAGRIEGDAWGPQLIGGGAWGPQLVGALRSAAANAHNFKVTLSLCVGVSE